jgi:hypothetical protein
MRQKGTHREGTLPLRWLDAAIFAFLLFVPVLGMISRLKTYSWVIAFLWIIIAFIMVSQWRMGPFGCGGSPPMLPFQVFWYEYRCRAELWYICICRGIILDFKKTHELKNWYPLALVDGP